YYGQAAAPLILEHIDRIHDFFLQQNIPLKVFDASRVDGSRFPYTFLVEADDRLARAESLAETDEQKKRVTVARLSVWYLMLEEAFAGRIGSDNTLALPIEWHFK